MPPALAKFGLELEDQEVVVFGSPRGWTTSSSVVPVSTNPIVTASVVILFILAPVDIFRVHRRVVDTIR
jgi:hypothetical protein